MKRKILSLILVFAMTVSLFTVGTGAVEPTYGDTAGHWAESSIERWSAYGIIQGSNGLFDPNGQLTCAQLATILAKLLKLPAAKDAGFTDNTADAWYYDAINRCAAAGILNGNGDGTVTPEAPITRERAMVMLARALGIEPIRKPDLTKYTDAAQVSAYAQGYVAALIEAGIVGGVTADELAPQDNINRASTVTILDRAISVYADKDGMTVNAKDGELVLVVAKNVKVINAPEGTKIVVADGATGLTRPGRFDRRVPVELPDLAGREAILKVHAKKIKTADNVDFHTIARMASGTSGAELANIINEAALRAVRSGRTVVEQADLEESIEVVIAGYQKKNAIMTDEEKKVVSYHEIGHALVAALQTASAPVQKITIIPRTSGALGYTMQVEQNDKVLMTKEELENKIATLTGGRAAEEIVFGQITTGASNDIEQATKLARAMITRYGMTDDFDMVAMETVNNQYLGGDTSLVCSAETQKEIDKKIVETVKKQHEKARRLLTENRDKLDELANYLYEKETITGNEFMAILNGKDGAAI